MFPIMHFNNHIHDYIYRLLVAIKNIECLTNKPSGFFYFHHSQKLDALISITFPARISFLGVSNSLKPSLCVSMCSAKMASAANLSLMTQAGPLPTNCITMETGSTEPCPSKVACRELLCCAWPFEALTPWPVG